MNKTILDYEEATSITPDDYIVMDSPSGGTSKILASTFGNYEPPEPEPDYLYKWDFTKSLTDSVGGKTASLLGATRTNEGIVFNAKEQKMNILGDNSTKRLVGKTYEFDIAKFEFKGNSSYHIRFFNLSYGSGTVYCLHPLCFRANTNIGWSLYGSTSASYNKNNRGWADVWSPQLAGNSTDVLNIFDKKMVKMVFGIDGKTVSLYLNNVLINTIDDFYYEPDGGHSITIGAQDVNSPTQSAGDQCFDMIISGLRIYNNIT